MITVINELSPLFILAIALGMDAFSACLGVGLNKLRLRQVVYISLLIGLFHALMPFLGILIGDFISETAGEIAIIASGVVLLLIGLSMISSVIFSKQDKNSIPNGFHLLVFCLSVSLDSFTVGLSLGMIGLRVAITLFIFAAVAASMSFAGLLLGKRIQLIVGQYGRILGGFILFVFGLKIIVG